MKKQTKGAKTASLFLEEFHENPYQKFNLAFALMSIIPFMAFFYLIAARLFTIHVLVGDIAVVMGVSIFVSLCGLLIGYGILKKMLRKIMFYAAQAKRQSELKSTFVATMAHEFRNPLYQISSNIKNVLETMPDQIGTEVTTPLQACQTGTDRMWDLATHLLDIYKIEAGLIKIEKSECDIVGLVERQVRELEGMIAKRNLTLNREIFGRDFSVWISEEKMTLAVSSLLKSSIKNSPEKGEVTLRVFPSGELIRLEIQHEGKGLSEDKLAMIFDKGDILEYKNREAELALAISKDLVELHGGRIWAESQIGKGLKFVIVLPKSSAAKKIIAEIPVSIQESDE
ncbi:MAG: HAMP domain-containing sensor histidine kinase [Candidatus Omnitrophota bacterium]